MHGAETWQTFEVSPDGDIVVHDPDALLSVADTMLQATLFTALPEGVTLHSLCEGIALAQAAAAAGEEWQDQKHRINVLWDGVMQRNFTVPPDELPPIIIEARMAIVHALQCELLKRPNSRTVQQEIYRRRFYRQAVRDWRLEHGDDDVPETDQRLYEVRFEIGPSSCEIRCAYPYSESTSLPEGSPQLSARLEIREGLPSLGLYSDIQFGDELACVVGAQDGVLAIRLNTEYRASTSAVRELRVTLGEELLVLKSHPTI